MLSKNSDDIPSRTAENDLNTKNLTLKKHQNWLSHWSMKKVKGHRLKPQLESILSWLFNLEDVVKEKWWYTKQNRWKRLKHKTEHWKKHQNWLSHWSEWVSEWCFTSLLTVFQSYRDGVCLWQILRVLPHSAASLEYRAANDPNTDTPPSHIILTPGQPVLVLSS